MNDNIILEVNGLRVSFALRKGMFGLKGGEVKAVDDVSFKIKKGQSLGLVGESGSGKTTVAKSLVGLVEAKSGEVFFEGRDVLGASAGELREMRKDIAIVFQDCNGALNPRMNVREIVAEPMRVNLDLSQKEITGKVLKLLKKVGLPEVHFNSYPHEFSGGQRQRIGLARALSLEPELIIFDEPTSSLDVSIQSQILNLLKDMQSEFGLTYLFISHDLEVVEFMCDHVAVMYMGQILEICDSEQLYGNPMHPYTRLLMSALEGGGSKNKSGENFRGRVACGVAKGCLFAFRCPLAGGICMESCPDLEEKRPGHMVRCWKCEKKLDLGV